MKYLISLTKLFYPQNLAVTSLNPNLISHFFPESYLNLELRIKASIESASSAN